jgi:DNA-binding transcriptional LysR family regulator
MDVPSLQAFLAVADTHSFSGAAERVYLTQPAISKRIATLEAELGVRLFDRLGRHTRLTEAGRALLPHGRAVLNGLEDGRRAIQNLSGQVAGELLFATSHHIGLHRLPAALKQFHVRYPSARLNIRFMDSERASAAVASGELELAVVTLPTTVTPDLRATPVWDDPLDVVVSTTHPLATAPTASLEQLTAYPAILPGAGTYTREIILEALGSLRDRLIIGMATNYLEVLKMLTAIGLGWSALPRTMIDDELKVVQIRKLRIRRTLGIVTSARRTLSNAGNALIDVIREHK